MKLKAVLVVILIIVIAVGAFWLGEQYKTIPTTQEISSGSNASSTASSTPPTGVAQGTPNSSYYSNVAAWQTDSDTAGDFSIAYPIDFQIDQNETAAPSTDWRLNANNTPGVKALTITIPSAFEPQTNFADAMLTVGYSNNTTAVAQCMTPDPSGSPNSAASSSISINGVNFTVFQSNSAGAGNLYQTTSYRTLHAGQCYAVEYTLHSSQIANYPAAYALQPFNVGYATSVLNNIVGTFTFL